MSGDFLLYEALLWEPLTGYYLLEFHLERLQGSARRFGFVLDLAAICKRLADYSAQLPLQPRKVRLELAPNGTLALNDVDVKPSAAVPVALAREPVESSDEFLQHKTSKRAVYERALAAQPEVQDVLLWNERRELTETCHANLVLEINGRKLTPPVSSGLLPGVFRRHLLESGQIVEQTLPLEWINRASALFLINSVRKWCPIGLRAA